VYLDADPTRLAQAFGNLLSNACKYTEHGGRIRVSAEPQDGEVIVSIRDTGLGIPSPMLDRIFDMFTQVDPSLEKSHGGLGIGLTIVKRLVEMHGGTIEARSEGLGKGSEFVVRLPVASHMVQETKANGAGGSVGVTIRRRILVADDNRDSARTLAMMLKFMGNEVRAAHDGQEAVDLAASYQPDVVLLDIGMPKLNGYDAARHIREQPWSRDVVLIALTGWGQEEDKRRSQEAGFDHHLVKPIEPVVLEKVLQSIPSAT
jgi:CheY-like chemotaxis protein